MITKSILRMFRNRNLATFIERLADKKVSRKILKAPVPGFSAGII